ncbi:MAG: glycosyltransferase family 4 protein [Anaerolineae bacterium]|nr:glycosyltransferase family 4 protein [Anaerolineae bacterium]
MMIDSWSRDFQTGGGHVAVWQLSQHLVRNHGCTVDIVTSTQPNSNNTRPMVVEQYLNGRLRLIRVGPCCFSADSFLGKLIYCVVAIPFVVRQRYQLINAHAFAAGLPGWVAGRLKGKPIIFTVQGIGQKSMDKMVGHRLKAKILVILETILLFKIKYDQEISVSRDIFEYPNVNQNIAVIPNGVNLAEFEAVTCKKADKFQLIFVGRFHPQKGLFDLVEAIRQVVRHQPNVQVLMVGTGGQLRTLKELIKTYRLNEHFIFTGHLTGVNKVRAFKSSHLFVLPSLYEGQPLTLLEAWAAKLPVLVTSVGANPDFVQEGENGYLVSPQRPEQLANVICHAIENPNLAQMGEKGYQLVQQQYSWDFVADQTFRLYKKSIATYQGRGT